MNKTLACVAVLLVVAGCNQPRGVGLGTVGAGGEPANLPASTRTEFEMGGVESLPLYRFSMTGDPSPADAINAGNSRLRTESENLEVAVESSTYFMRQI